MEAKIMMLKEGAINRKYNITTINANEEGMREFLFTLGCYPGEDITLISQLCSNYIINVKDARYSIDEDLAAAIEIQTAKSDSSLNYSSKAI